MHTDFMIDAGVILDSAMHHIDIPKTDITVQGADHHLPVDKDHNEYTTMGSDISRQANQQNMQAKPSV